MAPGLKTRAGPFGPSGVMPAWCPARMARVNAIKAAAPRRLDEPRTAVMPISLKKATSQAPSLLVLMRAEIGRPKSRWPIKGAMKSLSCQRRTTEGPSASSNRSRSLRKRRVDSQSRSINADGATQSQ